MSSKGIILLALITPVVFAQSPPARNRDDLDVTMHVIVDPDAKVPDEIVRRIELPKPAQPPPAATKPKENKGNNDQGREFGQQVSEDAKQRSEEARNNKKPKPPPGQPPGRPPSPPGRPPTPGG